MIFLLQQWKGSVLATFGLFGTIGAILSVFQPVKHPSVQAFLELIEFNYFTSDILCWGYWFNLFYIIRVVLLGIEFRLLLSNATACFFVHFMKVILLHFVHLRLVQKSDFETHQKSCLFTVIK